jgi:nucleotide-binding universal stress UspA family protein
MNRLKTIIVGVDFSECSRSALEQAARVAEWNQANLRVIHAIDDLAIQEAADAMSLSEGEIRSQARLQAVSRLASWAKELPMPDRHSREVIFGSPLDVLLQESRTSRADLLVLGVTGDSLLPFGAGTLATKCIRKAPCKVLLIKESHARPFRKIVACVDFSDTSREVVAQVLRVASQDLAETHFLHVFRPHWTASSAFTDSLPAIADFERNYRRVLETNLRQFANSSAGTSAIYAVHEAKSHGHGIAEYCREIGADLVILGTKGKTNLKYVLLGSTVERLLKEIPCSALVVRPPEAGG